MTRSERRLLINTSVLGIFLTLLIAALDLGGRFESLENFSYDERAKHCQFFQAPPTDKLVHIDIDDVSLEAIGAWPWPRARMADITDEIRIAGAKAMAFDIIYSEPQDTRYIPELSPLSNPSTQPSTRPASTQPATILARAVHDDELFAAALRRFGKAVVPVSLNLSQPTITSALYRAMVDQLEHDPDYDRDTILGMLAAQGFANKNDRQEILNEFIEARKEAIYNRIGAAITTIAALGGESGQAQTSGQPAQPNPVDLQSLRLAVLPRARAGQTSGVEHSFTEQYTRFLAVQSLRRFGRNVPEGLPQLVTARNEEATVESLSAAALAGGYVDYVRIGDGVVRSVPLVANYRNELFPTNRAFACPGHAGCAILRM